MLCFVMALTSPESRILSLLGKGKVTLAPKTEGELFDQVALLESPVTAEALNGTWRLLYTSKSAFDARNPLGKRVDGTSPGLEAFSGPGPASSSPIQRLLTSLPVEIQQNIDLGAGRVDQLVLAGDVTLRLSASALYNDGRLDFTFDLAYFEFLGLRVPYPVPFRLLGDEAKGWLDTTYVSDNLRISKGNKGTTFILARCN